MQRESLKRRWTADEDAAIRLSALRGWPTLRALAGDSGRSYYAIRLRASPWRSRAASDLWVPLRFRRAVRPKG